MKVERLARSAADRAAAGNEASRVFDGKVQGRVCGPHCAAVCPGCGSIACQCNCSRDCPDIARALSSDPDRYPIEPGIAPLVFEMKRLGIFRPCWSCEGHPKPDGSLWKLPSVWFYCDSIVHVRLLADGLKALAHDGKVRGTWVVNIAYSEPDNPDATFALTPSLNHDEVRLAALQKDAAVIAEQLERMIGDQARLFRRGVGGR